MSTLAYTTLREQVVTAIRMKILEQQLAPGERIIEQNLAQEFGVSRGPIREALRQLEQEGLVEYVRNAGCRVRSMTVEDIYEIFLLRGSYEMLAVGQYGGSFTPEELAEMEELVSQMERLSGRDIPRMIELDRLLHRILIQKTGLPRLMKSWEELDYGIVIAGVGSSSFRDSLTGGLYDRHRKLVEVLGRGDLNAIRQALYAHYMEPVKRIVEENGRRAEEFCFL